MYSVYWTLKSVTFISFIWSVMSRERFLFLLAFILFIWMVISSIFLTEWNGKLWPTYWFGPYLLKKFFHIFILYMLLIKPLLRSIKKGIVAWHDNLSALISPSNMFVCLGFFIPLEDFSLIWRRHHYRWKAADFDKSVHLWPLSNERSLACHTYCDKGQGSLVPITVRRRKII